VHLTRVDVILIERSTSLEREWKWTIFTLHRRVLVEPKRLVVAVRDIAHRVVVLATILLSVLPLKAVLERVGRHVLIRLLVA